MHFDNRGLGIIIMHCLITGDWNYLLSKSLCIPATPPLVKNNDRCIKKLFLSKSKITKKKINIKITLKM